VPESSRIGLHDQPQQLIDVRGAHAASTFRYRSLAQGERVSHDPDASRGEPRELAGKAGARAGRQDRILYEKKSDVMPATGQARRELLKRLAIRTLVRIAGFDEYEMRHGGHLASAIADLPCTNETRELGYGIGLESLAGALAAGGQSFNR